jgi:hypothetical protein
MPHSRDEAESQPRKTALDRRLLAYAAAGAGLAAAADAPAEPIYVDPPVEFRMQIYYAWDVERLGAEHEFVFQKHLPPDTYSREAWVDGVEPGDEVLGGGAYAFALPSGVMVSGEAGSWLAHAVMFRTDWELIYGEWLGWTGYRYLGFRFMISGETHYGWARISGGVRRLRDWAYESEPDTPILAGDNGMLTPVALPGLLSLAEGAGPRVSVFPNPANPSATLRMFVAEPGPVTLAIHDVMGRRVRTLWEGTRDRGAHVVSWDGTDDAGRPVASGVYFARLATPSGDVVTRVVLVR